MARGGGALAARVVMEFVGTIDTDLTSLPQTFLPFFSGSLFVVHLNVLPPPPAPHTLSAAPAAGPSSHRAGQAGHPSRDELHHKGKMFQPLSPSQGSKGG